MWIRTLSSNAGRVSLTLGGTSLPDVLRVKDIARAHALPLYSLFALEFHPLASAVVQILVSVYYAACDPGQGHRTVLVLHLHVVWHVHLEDAGREPRHVHRSLAGWHEDRKRVSRERVAGHERVRVVYTTQTLDQTHAVSVARHRDLGDNLVPIDVHQQKTRICYQ